MKKSTLVTESVANPPQPSGKLKRAARRLAEMQSGDPEFSRTSSESL